MKKLFTTIFLVIFTTATTVPPGTAQVVPLAAPNLPAPGVMVSATAAFNPPILKGLTIHPDNPFQFDFIVDTGDEKLEGEALKAESNKLIKYFLASLTVPEDQMWVNLSPYEKNRIIPESFGQTEMGRDLLMQDYMLKQLTASLMYPDEELGEEFWKRVYAKAQAQYGTTEIPMNTFNKIWIVPERAEVYVHEQNVFVVDSYLKVMLEEDYLALEKSGQWTVLGAQKKTKMNQSHQPLTTDHLSLTTELIRDLLIPEIEREVNVGKTFANLRQIYNASILATWFKQNLKESVLGQIYVDQGKTKGVDVTDAKAQQEHIYEQYIAAFKKGAFDLIKEEYDPATQQIIPHKYFSGGLITDASHVIKARNSSDSVMNSLTAQERRRLLNNIDGPFVRVSSRLGSSAIDPFARWVGMNGGDGAPISPSPEKTEDLLNFSERDRAIIKKFNQLQGKKKVVDMGSGTGAFSEKYRKMFPSEAIIGYETEDFAGTMWDKEWQVRGDAGNTGLLSESVDKVTINMPNPKDVEDVIPHLLNEARRILKPGGEIDIVFEMSIQPDNPLIGYLVRGGEKIILGALQRLGFIIEHAGEPLDKVEPNYPRTGIMELYEKNYGEINLFKAKLPSTDEHDLYDAIAKKATSQKSILGINVLRPDLFVEPSILIESLVILMKFSQEENISWEALKRSLEEGTKEFDAKVKRLDIGALGLMALPPGEKSKIAETILLIAQRLAEKYPDDYKKKWNQTFLSGVKKNRGQAMEEIQKILSELPSIHFSVVHHISDGKRIVGEETIQYYKNKIAHERFQMRLYAHPKLATLKAAMDLAVKHLQSDEQFKSFYALLLMGYKDLLDRDPLHFADEFWTQLYYHSFYDLIAGLSSKTNFEQGLTTLRQKIRTELDDQPAIREAFEILDETHQFAEKEVINDLDAIIQSGLGQELGFEPELNQPDMAMKTEEPKGLLALNDLKLYVQAHENDVENANVWRVAMSLNAFKIEEERAFWGWMNDQYDSSNKREFLSFFQDRITRNLRYMPIVELWKDLREYDDLLHLDGVKYAGEQQWIDDHRDLWENVLRIAERNEMQAHGTMNWQGRNVKSKDDKVSVVQHHWALLNIMIEGQVKEGDVGELSLENYYQHSSFNPARYGPYYVIFMQSDEQIKRKELHSDQMAIFLVPDKTVPFFEKGLSLAVTRGTMTDVQAEQMKDKIMTFEEFVNHQDKLRDITKGRITPAQVIDPNKGGIDLNPTMMNLRSSGESLPLHFPRFNAEQLNDFNVDGLYPIIINISPILNIPQLLGIKEEEQNLKTQKLVQKSS